MAIVYRHIRLDKNEPFYIGIGSGLRRAFIKGGRSKYWNSIVSKTDYEVQILFDDLTWEEACEKEIELIALYGRKDLGLGTLVNMTDGGQYHLNLSEESRIKMRNSHLGKKQSEETKEKKNRLLRGRVKSEETRLNMSIAQKGRIGKKHSEETKEKISISQYKPVLKLSLDGVILEEYISKKQAEEMNKIKLNAVLSKKNIESGRRKTAGGYKWKYKNNT
jgi:hypothetical protein